MNLAKGVILFRGEQRSAKRVRELLFANGQMTPERVLPVPDFMSQEPTVVIPKSLLTAIAEFRDVKPDYDDFLFDEDRKMKFKDAFQELPMGSAPGYRKGDFSALALFLSENGLQGEPVSALYELSRENQEKVISILYSLCLQCGDMQSIVRVWKKCSWGAEQFLDSSVENRRSGVSVATFSAIYKGEIKYHSGFLREMEEIFPEVVFHGTLFWENGETTRLSDWWDSPIWGRAIGQEELRKIAENGLPQRFSLIERKTLRDLCFAGETSISPAITADEEIPW